MLATFPLPAGSPFFTGHFPGHPILPGIAHLALVTQALGGAAVTAIPSLRLRNPVHPGDVLAAAIDGPAEDGTVRFELRRDEEVASSGTIRVGSLDAEPELPSLPEVPESSSFPPVADLLPHAPPARLVRSVLSVSPEGMSGIAEIPRESPFAVAGWVPAFLGLEAAAQGAAVLEALGRGGGGPRIGYLVALRGARFQVAALPVERPFRFTVRLTGSAAALSIYEVRVEGAGGAGILGGAISTWVPSEP